MGSSERLSHSSTALLLVMTKLETGWRLIVSWQEDIRSYFRLMEELVRRWGIPLALYSDCHRVFKFAGDMSGKEALPTQFAQAMQELGIRQIFARSPQVKGRVERAAGTFQDRLVTELRLDGVSTIGEANLVNQEFLIPASTRNSGCLQSNRNCLAPTGVAGVPGTYPLLQASP